ncbi:MAG TPA: reductive dehalogenase domain-containing protein [Kofleriaceae bacterium]
MKRKAPVWEPSSEQMQHWPAESGNAINGVGEPCERRPRPIYWHDPDATPHGPLQKWFYQRSNSGDPTILAARAERQAVIDTPMAPLADRVEQRADWSDEVKRVAREAGAADVGITAFRAEWTFQGKEPARQRWMIVIAVAQDYEAMASAPSTASLVEITRQYARGTKIAKSVASWLRERGHDALPYGGPMAGSFILIPGAIAAGIGQLGRHGSMIHPKLGSNFRLACVLTDVPLTADSPVDFHSDEFCASCRVCIEACPPAAILEDKQLVRGQTKYYVDFDKCLPFFNENLSCAICLAVCPFSRPGVGGNLVAKLAKRRT